MKIIAGVVEVDIELLVGVEVMTENHLILYLYKGIVEKKVTQRNLTMKRKLRHVLI